MQNQHQYINDYVVHHMLGDGGQAQVYLVSKDHQLYAAKVYLSGGNKADWFSKEVQCLQKLNSKNLVNIVESIPNATVKLADQQQQKKNVIIMEYAQGGEMFEYIVKQGAFKAMTCKKIFKQLLETIQYMNSKGISHRDIKPDNLLFDADFNLKVTDLGLAAINEGQDENEILTERVGTEGFRPPEMEKGRYNGLQADIFAAGVILFSMYSGSPPFITAKFSDKIYRIIREENYEKFWDLHEKKKGEGYFPKQFKKLLNSFFHVNPDKRPTLQALKCNEWLNQELNDDQIFMEMSAKYDKIASQDNRKETLLKVKEAIKNGEKKAAEEYQNETCESSKEFDVSFSDETQQKMITDNRIEQKV